MAKQGWLKFDDLFIPENKIVAVSRKKQKVTIHLQGGHEFTLTKTEGNDFWRELAGETVGESIVLAESIGDGDHSN